MAQFQSRPYDATAGLAIDAGLRAHMNSVYTTMSVGMLVTAGAAWAIAGLSVTTMPGLDAVQIAGDQYQTGFGQALYRTCFRQEVGSSLDERFLGVELQLRLECRSR